MFKSLVYRQAALIACLVTTLGCGNDKGMNPTPIEVTFGETTFVVLVNPIVNDANDATVPTPGSTQSGVTVSVAVGPSDTTNANGVVVLSSIEPGTKTLSLRSGGTTRQVTVSITDKDLHELAIAFDGSNASLMANVQYAFGGQVIEITPSLSLAEVNGALSQSNTIVFFRAGTYTGDLQFSGSDVTLFGEGPQGGSVTLNGNVTVNGSRNRIRGARITGNLTAPGSDFGMSFSQVEGALDLSGSNGTLLNNVFDGAVSISGSGTRLLGNVGM